MPRTAITLSKDHKGKWSLLHGPDVSIVEQLAHWREIRANHSHESIAEIHFQESDGTGLRHKMLSTQQQKEHDERIAAEQKKIADEIAAQKKSESKSEPQPDPEPQSKKK